MFQENSATISAGRVPAAGQEPMIHPAARELAALLRPSWPTIDAELRATGVPLCEGEGGAAGGQGGAGGEGAAGAGDGGAAAGAGASGAGGAGDGGQEPRTFDADYVKKLRDEAAATRTSLRDAQAELKKLQDRDKTDSEKLNERAADAEKRAVAAEARISRVNAAIKKKLPLEFADRLIGDTPEELEKDAERLAKQLTPGGGGGFDQGARGGGGKPQDMDALIRGAAGRT